MTLSANWLLHEMTRQLAEGMRARMNALRESLAGPLPGERRLSRQEQLQRFRDMPEEQLLAMMAQNPAQTLEFLRAMQSLMEWERNAERRQQTLVD